MAAEDPRPVRIEPVEKTVDWLRLERELLVDGETVAAVVTASSQTDRAIAFEVVDYLPANWMVEDIGFKLGEEPEHGSVAENRVAFEGVVGPDEPCVVAYEVVLSEPLDVETLQNDQEFSYPDVESASLLHPRTPPGQDATDESRVEATVEELFAPQGDSAHGLRDPGGAQASVADGMEFGTGSQESAGTEGPAAIESVRDRGDDRAGPSRSVAEVMADEIEAGDVPDGTLEALREALLGEAVADVRADVSRLDSRVVELDAAMDELAGVVDELDAARASEAETRRSIAAVENEVTALRSEIERAGVLEEDGRGSRSGADLGEIEQTVEDLRSELEAVRERRREEFDRLGAELREVRAAFDEWEAFRESLLRSLERER